MVRRPGAPRPRQPARPARGGPRRGPGEDRRWV